MRQKLVRIQISHQELLRKMLIFSQIFFIPVLIVWFISLNFQQSLNWQISLLSLKRVTEILRKTIDQSAYFQTSQKSLNDACFVKFPVLWIPIYQSNNVGLEKVTAHSIACWWCQKNGKAQYMRGNVLEHYRQIYLRHSTVFPTNCWWLRLAGTKTYSKLPIKQKTKE